MALLKDAPTRVHESDVTHEEEQQQDVPERSLHQKHRPWSRASFSGSILFNLGAFFLPALYGTLSKLWVAQIDSSLVVTTDVYGYIGIIVEVLNEGFPRSAWLIIGDKTTRTISSRLALSYTMIIVQVVLGLLITVICIAAAENLASALVPEQVRQTSLTYVRISSVQALSSTMETVVSSCTRALDHPDVPLVISSTKFVINIILDLLIISKFHVGSFHPTVNTQALVRMSCDMTSAIFGLVYFMYIASGMQRESSSPDESTRPRLTALRTLIPPSVYTFVESAIFNGLYLWLVTRIIMLGDNYATAWGVFITIRWGLVMVPVQALEASTLAFVGHNWGQWRARVGADVCKPTATNSDLLAIIRPALISSVIALIFEVIMCIALSTHGIQHFARYLSGSEVVAEITQQMWKAIDWTFVFFALSYQLGAILLATSPRWFLYQGLGVDFLWFLPWAIVVTKMTFSQSKAWTYYAVIFGGAHMVEIICVIVMLWLWAVRLRQGKLRIRTVKKNL